VKILVTGGEGWIGSHLVPKLSNHEVDILDLKSGRDIRTDPLKGDYDIIFHLAALRSVPKSFDNPRDYFDTNVYGTYRICEAFKCRIINISTSSASNPIAPYGLSKMLAENVVKRYPNVVSVRLFNPFGEGTLCPDLVIPIFAQAMLKNEPVYIHSDGRQDRDFTYVGDVVEELVSYISNHRQGTWELGYGEAHSVNEVFQIMAEYYKYDKMPIYIPKRIGDQDHTMSKDKMFTDSIGFYEGLRRTMEWYENTLSS
jgi:nucleoside-diphosphate-sugar epimerase